MRVKILAIATGLLILSATIVFAQDFCKGDFNYNGSVGAEDVTEFLNHFGRSQYNNPCPPDGPSPVAKTGQTTCYDASGDIHSCQLLITVGQDGNRRGVAWPNPRFKDNLNGTVTDNLTGLIWLKNANCFGQRTWYDAISDCNGLSSGSCGLTDGSNALSWRLPNRFEMESLLYLQYATPALANTAGTGQLSAGDPFNNVQYSNYWSSTSYVDIFSVNAWCVSMWDGLVHDLSKSVGIYVWPVRGGHR